MRLECRTLLFSKTQLLQKEWMELGGSRTHPAVLTPIPSFQRWGRLSPPCCPSMGVLLLLDCCSASSWPPCLQSHPISTFPKVSEGNLILKPFGGYFPSLDQVEVSQPSIQTPGRSGSSQPLISCVSFLHSVFQQTKCTSLCQPPGTRLFPALVPAAFCLVLLPCPFSLCL